MEFDEYGVKLKFPNRTCQKCIRYPCFDGAKICCCDFAKYGCKKFQEKKL